MRLPKIVLAGTAALALSLSLGACSMSVNGSGSGDSGSPAAQSEQKDTQGADSKDSSKTDAKGAATADSQSSSGGSAQASTAPSNKAGDTDDDKDGDDAPITDPTWKDIQSTGQRTEVSGAYTVQGVGTTLNLVGDLDTLTVQGSDVKISAEDVDTLTDGPADTLELNDIGTVALRLASPIPAEEYARTRAGGALVVVDPASGATLAAGMVESIRAER